MTREGVIMYAIRLPDGKWWRRGAGARGGTPTKYFKRATKYETKAAAMGAAVRLELGVYEVVEVPTVIGDVVMRVEGAHSA